MTKKISKRKVLKKTGKKAVAKKSVSLKKHASVPPSSTSRRK